MVLPITVTGRFLAPQGGPHKSGTSFYITGFTGAVDRASLFDVYKADSDDPSSGWTAQDTAGAPTSSNLTGSAHCILNGSSIAVAMQDTVVQGTDVSFHLFNCSTNSWTTIDNSVTTAPDAGVAFCAIGARSSDYVIAYQGAQETNMGTGYDRIDMARGTASSWTADISVDNLGKTTTHMRYPFVVMSANDRAHIFYHDVTGSGLHYSTYLSGNTWGHQHTEPDTSTETATNKTSVRAIRFDDGGTEKIRAFYKDQTSADISVVGFNDADSPGSSISIATDISDNTTVDSHAVAADGNTQHLLYETGTVIYHDETGSGNDTWGTDASELSSLSSADVFSANVYDNSGTVLAYLYLDGSNYRYNERTLAAATKAIVYKPNRFQHMKVR